MLRNRLRAIAVFAALAGATAAFAAVAGDENAIGLDLAKSMSLSPQETISQSREYYRKMQDVQKRVEQLQSRARKDKDVVKLNCVNDKLAQVRGHMAVADQSMSSLAADVSKGDDTARQHDFTRVTILHQKVVTLGTEAEQCVGEDVSYVGETRVDVEIDPSIPPDDATQVPIPVPGVARPPEASPYV